jgi:predicted acylesterase/phospholipase RssA
MTQLKSCNGINSNGLALSLASSELGFSVHAGFLDALNSDALVFPSHIGAASSGSYVGGLYAAGFTPLEIREILANKSMARSFLEFRAAIRCLGMLLNIPGYNGLLSGHKVASYLAKFLGDRRIEECANAELSIAVTNLTKGCPEIIKNGPLVEFIVASCSVPGLFKSREIGGDFYWDGAVCDSSPIYHFVEDDRINRILVHVITHGEPQLEAGRSIPVVKSFGQAHQIVTDRLLALAMECGKLRGKRVTVLNSVVPRYRWGKRGAADLLFEAGRQTVLQNIKVIREIGANSP